MDSWTYFGLIGTERDSLSLHGGRYDFSWL